MAGVPSGRGRLLSGARPSRGSLRERANFSRLDVTHRRGGSAIDGGAEERLVEEFREARDEESFRRLYRTVTPYLWAFARRLTGGRDLEAEELVQESWVRAVEGLDRYRGESALRTWLGGILLNCWRESRRELRWVAEEAGADRDGLWSAPPRGSARLEVERALAELPDGSRAVLLLFDLCGHSHEEIAERLGIPQGTSKRRLFDARRALRRRLGGPTGGTR